VWYEKVQPSARFAISGVEHFDYTKVSLVSLSIDRNS
jgi:hypothetical protein